MDRPTSARLLGRLIFLGAVCCFSPAALEAEEEIRMAAIPQTLELPSYSELVDFRDHLDRAEALIAREKEIDRQNRLRFFLAIADGNKEAFCELLNLGIDPDSEVPFPPTPDLAKKFPDELLRYYVTKEPGFSALMLAAALGNDDFVKILLLAGAKPFKVTHRHKTFALWLAGKYQHVEVMQTILGVSEEARRSHITVDLEAQQAILWRGVAMEFRTNISSGRTSHPTPKGRYVITNKYPMWRSSLYQNAKMPFFMRLSCGDFGFHAGNLPGYPASHGCIRLPMDSAKKLFADVPIGTLVEIR